MCFFTCSPRPHTLSQRHMDLHVWSYPRPDYIFRVLSKSVQGFRSPGGQDLAFPITLSSRFLANVLRYVRYMLSAVCLLFVVCLLSVTLVHPTQAVELFGNFFHHTIAQGLFWCQKSLVGDAPFPLKFSFKVTDLL